MPTKEGRILKNKLRQPKTAAQRVLSANKDLPLVERTNALNIQDFISRYVSPLEKTANSNADTGDVSSTSQSELAEVTRATTLDVYSAASISEADLEACLDLVELTSSGAYAASGGGWSRSQKRKEMRLPDMKYLIVHAAARSAGTSSQRSDAADANADTPGSPAIHVKEGSEISDSGDPKDLGNVLGFLSCMVTYEDGKEVIYCYEIHLSPEARGKGVGKLLMRQMEDIGKLVGLEKAMLTVFKSNTVARRFYEKGGYGVDEYSPQPRRLRNGTIKEFDYLILSKRLDL